MSQPAIAALLGRIPSGIFILTARHAVDGVAQETGMLTSWVMQAGFDPPMLTVAVRQGRYVGDWLQLGAPFALNVVGHEQPEWLKHFGKGFEPGEPAFAGLEIARSAAGVPVLAKTLGHLECATRGQINSGDHVIFLAEVTSAQLIDGETRPMVHLRKSGLHY